MRTSLWLGFAASLVVALAIVDGGDAQPGKKGPPFGKKGDFPRGTSTEQIVERIMSFDKNKSGKITAEDLPERMQHLIALGDLNKDGALDKEEVRKLAAALEAFASLTGNQGPGPGGPPPGPKGDGFKGDGFKGKGAPKGSVGEVQRTIDELNLAPQTRDKAQSLVRVQQDKVRRAEEQARTEIIAQMKDVLSEEDYRIFKSALDRPPGKKGPPKGPPGGDGELNRRIDQLQAELDDLRRKLPK